MAIPLAAGVAVRQPLAVAPAQAASPPAGGTADIRGFVVRSVISTTVAGDIEHVVYHPQRDVLFASVAPTGTFELAGLRTIDLNTGNVTQGLPSEGSPAHLALSDEGRYLYYSNGPNKTTRPTFIHRIDLDQSQIDQRFGGGVPIADMKVVPGQPGSLVVVQFEGSLSQSRLLVFDNAVLRPRHALQDEPLYHLDFLSPTTLRAIGRDQLYRLELRADGVVVSDTIGMPQPAYAQYADGRIYTSNGVFDDTTGAKLWDYVGLYPSSDVQPVLDPANPWLVIMAPGGQLSRVYDRASGRLLGTFDSAISGPYLSNMRSYSAGPNRVVVTYGYGETSIAIYTLAPQYAAAHFPMIVRPDPAAVLRDYPIANRCTSISVPNTGTALATVDLCVTNVQFRFDGNMTFVTRWTVTYLTPTGMLVYKGSDVGNRNMYATDEFGNRYDHVALIGAAGETVWFPRPTSSATGGYVFPPRRPGAQVFRFHDADQGVVVNDIRIEP